MGSEKVTTIRRKNVILTTLQILEQENYLKAFLKEVCGYSEVKSNIPDWAKDYEFYDDSKLKHDKLINEEEIEKLRENIIEIDNKLNKNNEYKKLLYETGDELVDITKEVLEQLLNYSTKDFIDKKNEDLCIKLKNITFIFEIKGVNHGIKNSNISQLDEHCDVYLEEIQIEENIKGILIMNSQRNKCLEERDKVHEKQIEKAKRNESLIIETKTLLNMFEDFKNDKLSSEKCMEIFSNTIGLLEY